MSSFFYSFKLTAKGYRINIWLKYLAYIAPMVGFTILSTPVAMVLGGIYVKYFGLSLASVGAVMLLARLFDAITDPLIGY